MDVLFYIEDGKWWAKTEEGKLLLQSSHGEAPSTLQLGLLKEKIAAHPGAVKMLTQFSIIDAVKSVKNYTGDDIGVAMAFEYAVATAILITEHPESLRKSLRGVREDEWGGILPAVIKVNTSQYDIIYYNKVRIVLAGHHLPIHNLPLKVAGYIGIDLEGVRAKDSILNTFSTTTLWHVTATIPSLTPANDRNINKLWSRLSVKEWIAVRPVLEKRPQDADDLLWIQSCGYLQEVIKTGILKSYPGEIPLVIKILRAVDRVPKDLKRFMGGCIRYGISLEHDIATFDTLRTKYSRSIVQKIADQIMAGNRTWQDLGNALPVNAYQNDILPMLAEKGFLGVSPETWTTAVRLGRRNPEVLAKGPHGFKKAIKEVFGDLAGPLALHPEMEDIIHWVKEHAEQASFTLDDVVHKGYRLSQLDPTSGLDLIVGDLVGSCQTWEGYGEECAMHAASSSHGATWAIFKGDTMVAHAWVWVPKKDPSVLVIDNIESGIINDNKAAKKLVAEVFELGIQQVLNGQFDRVLVGTQYTKIRLPNRGKKGRNPYKAPVEYTDAKKVWNYTLDNFSIAPDNIDLSKWVPSKWDDLEDLYAS